MQCKQVEIIDCIADKSVNFQAINYLEFCCRMNSNCLQWLNWLLWTMSFHTPHEVWFLWHATGNKRQEDNNIINYLRIPWVFLHFMKLSKNQSNRFAPWRSIERIVSHRVLDLAIFWTIPCETCEREQSRYIYTENVCSYLIQTSAYSK